MIPYGRQTISEEDIETVIKILKSDYLTQGPNIKYFETTISKRTNSKYGIATESKFSRINDAFSFILILNCSAKQTISIAFEAPAAIDGQMEVVNINPGAKLLIKSIISEFAAIYPPI